jgi:hypothetical protein
MLPTNEQKILMNPKQNRNNPDRENSWNGSLTISYSEKSFASVVSLVSLSLTYIPHFGFWIRHF